MSNPDVSTEENPVSRWFRNERKFKSPLFIILLIFVVTGIGYHASRMNNQYTIVAIGLTVGILLFIACLRHPLFGMYFTILFSCTFALPGRFYNMVSPVGILVEIFTYALFVAVLRSNYPRDGDFSMFWRNPVTIVLLTIMGYYILEIGNPASETPEGWFFFVRKQVSFLLFYYVAFVLLNSYERIRFFLKFTILLVLVIALYGIKQHWFGLAGFESAWMRKDPLLMELFFQGGFLRKFSFLTDPPAFGVICASTGLLTLVLGLRLRQKKIKYLLYLVTAVLFLASTYSGSRTCNLMIIAGLAAYSIFTLNERRTYLLLAASACIGALFLFGPLRNDPVINRIQTSFRLSQDPSASLRDRNRHRIQPYIYAHPFGGGLNTSSIEGVIYTPGHYLAGFPPDSGYMKILLEQGWVGFAMHLVLYFVILKRGIDCFFKANNPAIKSIYIALTVFIFSLVVGQYSQVAISQYPLMLFYFPVLAILVKLIDFDTPKPEENVSLTTQ